jgi:hypothetical protein
MAVEEINIPTSDKAKINDNFDLMTIFSFKKKFSF